MKAITVVGLTVVTIIGAGSKTVRGKITDLAKSTWAGVTAVKDDWKENCTNFGKDEEPEEKK